MTEVVRLATTADLDAVIRLATSCIPKDEPTLDAPGSGELEAGIENGMLSVIESDGTVIGMLRAEHLSDHVHLGLLAVDPEYRGRGHGRRLVDDAIARFHAARPRRTLTASVDSSNLPAIALLAAVGITPRRGIRDYAGPGRDRLYCRLDTNPAQPAPPEDRALVPVTAHGYLLSLLDDGDHAITGVVPSAGGTLFEVSTIALEDEHSLKVDEASVGVTEAGSIAAGLTFLLGISFAVPDYAEPLRVLLLFATILTVGSLQIFASATGPRSRTVDDSFTSHMKWGNLLLEYGGLLPVAIVLPSVFDQASPNESLSFVVAILVSIALAVYEYSPFSLARARPHGVVGVLSHVLAILSILLPIAADPLFNLTGDFLTWSALVGVVMIARIAVHAGVDPAQVRSSRRRPRRAR
ncbi:hypothetical protein BH10ACT7_BH10ACT7_20260 [soil metagenome]